ncbi:MAG: fatty acid desaturase [Ilumatobacteraceae bacterium]
MISTVATALVAGITVTTIANLATTIYLHRGLAHRAISFPRPVDGAFKTVIWLATGIKVREWVAVHRKHHAHTDTELDPHSPAVSGWWTVQKHNLAMYRRAAHDQHNIERYARDLPPTRWDRVVFDRSWLGLLLGLAALCAVLGVGIGLLAAAVHLAYYVAASAAVNAIGHHFGRRPYRNSATNLQWLALLTAGEGLHNNHHAAPTSAKLAHRRYEFDPAWLVVKPMTWLGLAEVRVAGTKLRPDATTPAATP